MTNQVKQDLEGAVEALDAHGWCQGRNVEPDGRVCSNGAIMQAVGILTWDGRIKHGRTDYQMNRDADRADDAMRALSEQVPEGWRCSGRLSVSPAIEYNDDPATTVEDVKLMFKRAIEARED